MRTTLRGEVSVRFGVRSPRCRAPCSAGTLESSAVSVFAGAALHSVASRSAMPPTRLETRTKESSMRASQWVYETQRRSESKGRLAVRGAIPLGRNPGASHRPRIVRSSKSTHAGTRKMVNYAWPGRSQGKPWWRTVAILTCKSIVGAGYRGERLIEPSSSWFLPKFPSG